MIGNYAKEIFFFVFVLVICHLSKIMPRNEVLFL
jgi:hypothetical protein